MKSTTRLVTLFALAIALQGVGLAAEPQSASTNDYQFRLSFGQGHEEYFSRCSGIGSTSEVIEHRVSAPGGAEYIRKVPGRVKFNDIVCIREIQPQKGASIWSWRREVEKGRTAEARLDGTITLLSLERGELFQWNVAKAWPTAVYLSPYDPGQEVLVLAVEDIR